VCQCVSVCVSVCQCVSVCVSVCQCVSVCVSVCQCVFDPTQCDTTIITPPWHYGDTLALRVNDHPIIQQSSDHPSIPDPSSFSLCRCFLLATSGAHYFQCLCLPFSSSFASATNNGSSIISPSPKKARRSEQQKSTQSDEYPYSPDNCMMFLPIELYKIFLPWILF
jgi:hypothetical protein